MEWTRPAGVVVETGGDLSHGPIILREIGLPAVMNVRGVTRMIATGDTVRLRAGVGVVERVGNKGRPARPEGQTRARARGKIGRPVGPRER